VSQKIERGDIVLIRFPFTDLSGSKRRPAVILATYLPDVIVSLTARSGGNRCSCLYSHKNAYRLTSTQQNSWLLPFSPFSRHRRFHLCQKMSNGPVSHRPKTWVEVTAVFVNQPRRPIINVAAAQVGHRPLVAKQDGPIRRIGLGQRNFSLAIDRLAHKIASDW
jgi:hypothetical protein